MAVHERRSEGTRHDADWEECACERNIIGKVTMLPMTPAVSGFLVTVPTSIPSAANSMGPKIRKGISQSVNATCAPKAKIPTSHH